MTYAEKAIEPEMIDEMREWIRDCDFMDLDVEDVDELLPQEVLRGIARHYDGGVLAFVQTVAG